MPVAELVCPPIYAVLLGGPLDNKSKATASFLASIGRKGGTLVSQSVLLHYFISSFAQGRKGAICWAFQIPQHYPPFYPNTP